MFQQCMIVGNLGKDPEMRYTPDGTAVTTFTVAVSRRWSGGEGGSSGEKTWWFKVSCWRKLAETTNQYLKKGRQVLVIGEIDASAWMDQDGKPRASLELTAREVKFLGKREDGGMDSELGSGGSSGAGAARDEEDIPF